MHSCLFLAVMASKPLLMNFLTRTTTLTLASPSEVRGLSMSSIGSLLLKLGALAVLW